MHSPDVLHVVHQATRAKTGLVARAQHRGHIAQSGVDAVADKLVELGQAGYRPKIADVLHVALLVQD
jgi:uncharacterized protein YgbK (DUF1537 family)